MFLLQLLKMGKMQELMKSGLRVVRQHGILREGQHGLTVSVSVIGEDGKRASTDIHVGYSLEKSARLPSIVSLDAEDWTVEE